MDEKEKFHYICDALVMKDIGFNYLMFLADNDDYSRQFNRYPAGEIVEVYIKVKGK